MRFLVPIIGGSLLQIFQLPSMLVILSFVLFLFSLIHFFIFLFMSFGLVPPLVFFFYYRFSLFNKLWRWDGARGGGEVGVFLSES